MFPGRSPRAESGIPCLRSGRRPGTVPAMGRTYWISALVAAFLAGVLAKAARLPPLLGFLAAGFALSAFGIAMIYSAGVVYVPNAVTEFASISS